MLEYIALGLLVFMAMSLLFGAIAIVHIPYRIARERGHPHQDAIHCAGWASLLSLHALWPLLWIWASAGPDDSEPRLAHLDEDTAVNDKREPSLETAGIDNDITDSMSLLGHKYEVLDDRLERIERAIMAAGEAA